MPPITRSTDAVGNVGVNGTPAAVLAVIGYVAADGALTVTTAKRIDPSGQVVLTSVCVASVPTFSAPVAAPCGSACPNVAQPGVSATEPTAVCACARAATQRNAIAAERILYTRRRPAEGPRVARDRLSPEITECFALRREVRDL